MVEWFKAAVLKTAEGRPSVGSNPTPSAIFYAIKANQNRLALFFYRQYGVWDLNTAKQ